MKKTTVVLEVTINGTSLKMYHNPQNENIIGQSLYDVRIDFSDKSTSIYQFATLKEAHQCFEDRLTDFTRNEIIEHSFKGGK